VEVTGMKIADPVNMLPAVEVGTPRTVRNLTVFPLSGNRASSLDYLLLDDALMAEKVAIEEVNETGSSAELRMANFSNRFILVVDGTELVGGKHNRIVNASFLIPPESLTKIPVSSVEQGRSQYSRREFKPSRHFSPHSIRRENVAFHRTSLRQRRGYVSDQMQVWARVADMSQKLGAPTPNGSMNEVMEQKSSFIEGYRVCMALEGSESGAAYFLNGIFQGIELFDRPSTFRKMCPKLLSGIAADSMMGNGERLFAPRAKGPDEASEYIRRIIEEAGKSAFEKYEPIGVGEDWRYDAKRSFGKALHYGADLIHFSAFGK
jgi:hypothetical protein